MTKTEIEVLLDLLDDYGNELSNRGCNDYTLEDTPANRKLMKAVIAASDYPDDELSIYNGQIYTQDFKLLGYFENKLKLEMKNK